MKTKMMVMAAMATVLLAAGACSPAVGASAPKDASVEVTIDEFTSTQQIAKAIEMAEGGVLTVSLGSNPTTGFSWNEAAQIADTAILQQTDSYFQDPDNKGVVGASGTQVWTFEALQKGTTVVTMEYGRPWEGGERGCLDLRAHRHGEVETQLDLKPLMMPTAVGVELPPRIIHHTRSVKPQTLPGFIRGTVAPDWSFPSAGRAVCGVPGIP